MPVYKLCPNGLPGTVLPLFLGQASHSTTLFTHAWLPGLACFRIGWDLSFSAFRNCSSWAGPQRPYLPFSWVVVAFKTGKVWASLSFDLEIRIHFRSLTWFCLPAYYSTSEIKKESIKGLLILCHAPCRFCRLTEILAVWKGSFWSSRKLVFWHFHSSCLSLVLVILGVQRKNSDLEGPLEVKIKH